MVSPLFQDRSLSPSPALAASDQAQSKGDTRPGRTEQEEAKDRAIADVLLAADIEDEMEDVGEDVFEEIFDDENKASIENNDEGNKNLISKPKRKMELKAGLLKEILFNKPKRHTFSGLYM